MERIALAVEGGFRLVAVGQFCKFNDYCRPKQSLDCVLWWVRFMPKSCHWKLTRAEWPLWHALKWCYQPNPDLRLYRVTTSTY